MNHFSIGEAQTDKKELSKFQGVWSRTFGEVDMVTVPDFVFVDSLMVVGDDRATITEGEQTFEMEIVRLDTSTDPKHIDIKSLSGPEKDSISFGIYELEGDSLRICHSLKRHAMRPDKFEILKGSGLVHSLWKRVIK